MRILSTIEELTAVVTELRASQGRVGFVPTMGALHEGHLSLMRRSKNECDTTIVSIFVNPTQFGPNEDFTKYPRTLEADCALLESENVEYIFTPTPQAMYPENSATSIVVGEIATIFEGEIRPGHFSGVATIVASLFNLVQPDIAYFGQKDLQQVAVIKQMVRDLHFPVEIVVAETIREKDGLAMSSRNRYLTAAEREESLVLYRTLETAKLAILSGKGVEESIKIGIKFFRETAKTAVLDYLSIVEKETFQIPHSFKPGREYGVIIAARLGATRLIDNIVLAYDDQPLIIDQ